MEQKELIDTAVKIAKKFIKPQEGLSLLSYPDPDSEMGKALTAHGQAKNYRDGKFTLPESFLKLSPEPITIGFGETFKGLKLGVVWTLEQAETALDVQVKKRVMEVLKATPALSKHSPEKLAACVSLQYNIGASAFASSTLVKMLNKNDMTAAALEFPRWNKDNGHTVQGLTNRRAAEVALFNSVRE